VILKPGRLNAGLNHRPMIKIGEELSSLEEGLPDAQLFAVHTADDHFTNIIQFLTMGTTLEGYSTQYKKELVVRATYF